MLIQLSQLLCKTYFPPKRLDNKFFVPFLLIFSHPSYAYVNNKHNHLTEMHEFLSILGVLGLSQLFLCIFPLLTFVEILQERYHNTRFVYPFSKPPFKITIQL